MTAIDDVADEAFGLRRLRPGQQEAIEALVEGRDVLAVMPTGAGKSAIYQVAALLVPGPTIVVSPLISLQQDQMQSIEEDGAGGAVQANSKLSAGKREEALERVGRDAEFLFLAPEQFAVAGTVETLAAKRPSLLVVDEAHCVSSWGHDFRPDYLRLGAVAEALGRPRIVALTATATGPVRDELIERLGLRDPLVLMQGFDRPELSLAVERFTDEASKRTALCDRVAAAAGPGIVYAATRAGVVDLAETLRARGLRAAAYHGGLPAGERDAVQDAFMAGALDVVVATTAFGMGIDKEDVRFVFHLEPSDSLDSYYQEIGRAGRDGKPADAVLYYRPEDLGVRRFFAGGARIEEEELAQLVRVVQERGEVVMVELAAVLDMSVGRCATAVGWLERDDVVQVRADGVVVVVDHRADAEEAAGAAADVAEARRRTDASRVEMVRGYAETRHCRRRFLLNYLGEAFEPPCDACDVCLSGRAVEAGADGPFAVGDRVVHESFGGGAVSGCEGDKVVVLFDEHGYKTLLLDHVVSAGMLQPES